MQMLVARGRRALTAALVRSRQRECVVRPVQSLQLRFRALPVSGSHQEQQIWRRGLSTANSSESDLEPPADSTASSTPNASEEAIIQPKNEQDALFLKALRLYYERNGDYFVPQGFVVPSADETPAGTDVWPKEMWGMPLGIRVRSFSRGMTNQYKRSLYRLLEFPYDDWKTYVWEEQLMPSLKLFKETEGHTFVRSPYTVPVNDPRYPKCTWGFKLGFAVAALRQQRESLSPAQRQTLQDMEFIWTENHFKLKVVFLRALRRYREIFGHTEVPSRFLVPTPNAAHLWDPSLHGSKLGYLYSSLKTGFFDQDAIDDCADELRELGVFEAGGAEKTWRATTVPALQTFVQLHGHTQIPCDFVVPSGDTQWPEDTWGYNLGYTVHCIITEGVFGDQVASSKPELRGLGYRWDILFGRWSRQLLPALRAYHELYNDCEVPVTFVVPDDAPWPEEARKFNLGRQLQAVRKLGRDSPDVADMVGELDMLGFRFNIAESDFQEKILPALTVFAAMYGHCDVPRGFVVPSDAAWPESAWGVRLGSAATSIRARKGQYRELVDAHRQELKKLGFSWPLPQTTTGVDREIAQPCLAIYKELHGPGAVPELDFVVPANDDRWPVEASGFKLGRWLHAHSRRGRMDAMIVDPSQSHAGSSYSSLSSSSLPAATVVRRSKVLEPHQEQYWNEVLLASFQVYAQLHGSCRDMDDNFVVPSEAPFPQTAWGLNLGLRLRYVRHHDRYAAEVTKYHNELEAIGVIDSTSPVAPAPTDA
jgi:hypothetical protein